MPVVLHIAIPGPLRQAFDYLAEQTEMGWQKGVRVQVPFGHRQVIGIVIGISEDIDTVEQQKLKSIDHVIDQTSLLPNVIFELILWTSQYYHHPIGDCFQTALPKKLRLGDPAELVLKPQWQLNEKNSEQKLGKKQQQIIEQLTLHQGVLFQDQLYRVLGPCRDALVRLENKGIISRTEQIDYGDSLSDEQPLHNLISEQSLCLKAINSNDNKFSVHLLHGVTGSGKTEVYLALALQLLAKQKKVLVLIPEIGLTDQFVERFKHHIPGHIVVFHSGMTDSERLQAWLLAQGDHVDIVIGTRSAVFIPLPRLGAIVIDEEHDSAYKQQDSLRYHARQVALMRARNEQVPIVLGSATPSLESYYQAQSGHYQLLTLMQRATGALLPEVMLVDSQASQHSGTGLSTPLFQAIEAELAAGNQVLLFINQRGYAPVMMCHDCGWQATCPDCDAKLIIHQQRYQLRCHHCGYNQPLINHCPECDSEQLAHYGIGTEQIEQVLKPYFPSVPILRIDRDSTQNVGSFAALRQQINTGESAILVGTQMLAKGHDFHDVTLVGILDADQGLFSADYRATEGLAQLLIQVMGRAGRGDKPGKVYIQTQELNHPFWQAVVKQDYQTIVEQLLVERQQSTMPPFGSLCLIRARGKQPDFAMQFLSDVSALLRQTTQQAVLLLGPVPAVMEKRAGYYRAQLLLVTTERKVLHQLLDHHMTAITQLKSSGRVKWSIDVDPIDLI